ncbi:MAG: DUF4184 family protein [Planctomycetaceae bacterium]
MPFTPTHIVAILPFRVLNRWLPFSALAIGSMIPDVGLFFPIARYGLTHSPVGIFTACLPMGLIAFLLFDLVMRRPLRALLPEWIQRRIDPTACLPNSDRVATQLVFFIGVSVAIAIGAATHQIWDAFTHRGRWGTLLVPELDSEILLAGIQIPGYKLFQYGSTLVGLPLLMCLATWELLRSPADSPIERKVPFRWKILTASVVPTIPLVVAIRALATEPSYDLVLATTIKVSGTLLMSLAVIGCSVFRLQFRDLCPTGPLPPKST